MSYLTLGPSFVFSPMLVPLFKHSKSYDENTKIYIIINPNNFFASPPSEKYALGWPKGQPRAYFSEGGLAKKYRYYCWQINKYKKNNILNNLYQSSKGRRGPCGRFGLYLSATGVNVCFAMLHISLAFIITISFLAGLFTFYQQMT